jgi:hypothetical protein
MSDNKSHRSDDESDDKEPQQQPEGTATAGETITFEDSLSKDGSAATSGTIQSTAGLVIDENGVTVTVQPLPPDPNAAGEDHAMTTRRRYVSMHRKTLEHIEVDQFQNRRHRVPDQKRPRKANGWPQKAVSTMQETIHKRTCGEWLEVFLPMAKWLKVYKWRQDLIHDIIAGCTVGVMIVPQSMSYAKLAGLPVEYGLYSALVPVYAYAVFGSSRQLAVGPVALISLLLSTGLAHVLEKTGHTPDNTPNYQHLYNTLAVQTSFLVGISYVILGLLR